MVNINVSLFKHAENWIEQLTYNSHTSFAEYKIVSLTWTKDILTISDLQLSFSKTIHSLKYIARLLFLGLSGVLHEHILSLKALLMIWFFLQLKSCCVFPLCCQRWICRAWGREDLASELKRFNFKMSFWAGFCTVLQRDHLDKINGEQFINCDHPLQMVEPEL